MDGPAPAEAGAMRLDEDLLGVLACDLLARPAGAPGPDDLRPWVTSVARERDRLIVEFDQRHREPVAAFVAAESQCCATLRWTLSETPAAIVTVEATGQQLDGLMGLFAPG